MFAIGKTLDSSPLPFFFFFDSLILVAWEELEEKGSDVLLTNMAEDKGKLTQPLPWSSSLRAEPWSCHVKNVAHALFYILHNKASEFRFSITSTSFFYGVIPQEGIIRFLYWILPSKDNNN